MFLKSVKARGFKSFAQPVEFAFEPGITVVVGPNGSGKSNIVDAVLWAMGEQSPSAVRGSKMQDVIFSGSDKLSPSGMAEVELLLDNSSNLLPIEFSEVLISRRLYRDGEGSYYINKSPSRMIDVHELLSDAGLGRDSHSIISQGKVDSILESKPFERRSYIEEAAGLGKFKKRRHRAERKLEAVRRNLERLADVEEEVKVNLRPLKRQATAAERSSKLDKQIAVAQTRLIKGKLDGLRNELKDAESASKSASEDRRELERRLSSTAEERRRSEEMLSSSLKGHKGLSARFYSLKSKSESLKQKEEAVSQRRFTLLQAGRRAEARIGNLKGQIENAEAELERARAEHSDGRTSLVKIEAELGIRQDELANLEAEIEKRQQAGQEKKKRINELEALKDRAAHQTEYLRNRQRKLAGSIESSREQSRVRRSKLQEIQKQYDAEKEQLSRRRTRYGEAEAVVKSLDERLAVLDEQKKEVSSELGKVDEALRIAKARLTFIGDSDRDRSGLPPAVKKISEQHEVKTIVDLLDVEPGYERAVSAVMGKVLFALAVDDMKTARQLLDEARSSELGSIDFLFPRDQAEIARNKGEDYLLDHVNVPSQYEKFVASLFAGVRVMQDDAELPAQASEGTWVTREGVVFFAGRRLLSYKADPPSSFVLKQRNERRKLEDEKKEIEKNNMDLSVRAGSLDEEYQGLKGRRAEAEDKVSEIRNKVNALEENLDDTEQRKRVLLAEAELEEARAEQFESESKKLGSELREASESLEKAEKDLSGMGTLNGAREGLTDDELEKSRAELGIKVTDLQITAARVREREQVAARTIERVEPGLARLQQEVARAQGQLVAYKRFSPVCERMLSCLRSLEELFAGSVEELDEQLKKSEEESERHSAGLRQLSQAEAELQQELSKASDKSTLCEVSVAKLRDHAQEQSERLSALEERYPDEGLAEVKAAPDEELEDVQEQVERLVKRRESIGPVNPLAQQEYEEMLERQNFLVEQRADLEKSLSELTSLIKELSNRIESTFSTTFEAVRKNFAEVVSTLFPGGEGRLSLVEPETVDDRAEGEEEFTDEEEADRAAGVFIDRRGIEISVKPARKAVRSLSLLSGGERSLVAIAFLFAIFLARPAPFYILDEVEAALDDSNINRLLNMLRRYQTRTQFVVITHQKRTMEAADVLYGVSMGADGTSKVLSRRMSEITGGDEGPGDDPEAGGEKEGQAEPAAVAG